MAGAHLIAIPYGDAPALLGTNFGQQSTPAWALKLEAEPAATLSYRGATLKVVARLASDVEQGEALARSGKPYLGYRKYQAPSPVDGCRCPCWSPPPTEAGPDTGARGHRTAEVVVVALLRRVAPWLRGQWFASPVRPVVGVRRRYSLSARCQRTDCLADHAEGPRTPWTLTAPVRRTTSPVAAPLPPLMGCSDTCSTTDVPVAAQRWAARGRSPGSVCRTPQRIAGRRATSRLVQTSRGGRELLPQR